jgi:hypothetical protein
MNIDRHAEKPWLGWSYGNIETPASGAGRQKATPLAIAQPMA